MARALGRHLASGIGKSGSLAVAILVSGPIYLPILGLDSGSVRAETPPAPPARIRKVTPRRPGDGPRINIFIGDGSVGDTSGGQDAPAPVSREVSRPPEGRFWTTVSADMSAATPSRLPDAVAHAVVHTGSGVNTGVLRGIASRFSAEFERSGRAARVSPALLLAVAYVESRGQAAAVSPAGAVGVMQLMPGTAARFGVQNSRNAGQNIRGGATYLDLLLQLFKDDVLLALAGYNAGENAVLTRGAVPPFRETRDYVPKVLTAWEAARGLCLVPPVGVRDSCTFSSTVLGEG